MTANRVPPQGGSGTAPARTAPARRTDLYDRMVAVLAEVERQARDRIRLALLQSEAGNYRDAAHHASFSLGLVYAEDLIRAATQEK